MDMTETLDDGSMRLSTADDIYEGFLPALQQMCEEEGYGTMREVILSMWAEAEADEGCWRPGFARRALGCELAEVEQCGEYVPEAYRDAAEAA